MSRQHKQIMLAAMESAQHLKDVERFLKQKGFTPADIQERWHAGSGNWFARYFNKDKEVVLVTATAMTGEMVVEVLISTAVFRVAHEHQS